MARLFRNIGGLSFADLMMAAPLAATVMALACEPYGPGSRGYRDGGPRRDPPKPDINGPCSYRATGSKRSRRRQADKPPNRLPVCDTGRGER